jgi:Ca2+-binding RTX toxin-like protein
MHRPRPAIESLEPRVLLSASFDAGVLTIMGTDGNDAIDMKAGPRDGEVVLLRVPGVARGTVYRQVEAIIIETGDGNDRIRVNRRITAEDGTLIGVRIDAGAGDDRIDGGDGDDVIDAGDGNDRIRDHRGDNRIDAGDGRNTILTGDGDDRIAAGSGDDRINDRGGNNIIEAGDGNNRINTGMGDDIIETGDGVDRIFDRGGDNLIDAGCGDDVIHVNHGTNVIDAGDGHDRVKGGRGNDRIFGGAGNDIINAASGDDEVHGGDGNDRLMGGPGQDMVNGGEGDDDIRTSRRDTDVINDIPTNVRHESEGNNHAKQADRFALGDDGVIRLVGEARNHRDNDWFTFTAEHSGDLSVQVSTTNGQVARLVLQSEAGGELLATDPDGGVNGGVVAIEAGTTYLIRMHSTERARAGYVVDLELTPTDGGGAAPQIEPPTGVIAEAEVNDLRILATAFALDAGGAATLTGVSDSRDDKDYFVFTAPADGVLSAVVTAPNGEAARLVIADVCGDAVLATQPGDGVNAGEGRIVAGTMYFVMLRATGDAAAAYSVDLLLTPDAP